MGPLQRNIIGRISASSGRPSRWLPQACLRMGCANVFQPRRWNHRYCQDEHCRRELRRWQNARRQQRRRQRVEVRRQHAERERARRQQRRAATGEPEMPAPTPAPPTGGEAPGAWSRGKKNSAPFCQRPGCYEPLPDGGRLPYRYCGPACGAEMRRVQERERKRLRRRKLRAVGRQRVARTAPPNGATAAATSAGAPAASPADTTSRGEVPRVRNSRIAARNSVSSRPTPDDRTAETVTPHPVEEAHHDRETPARPRPRPPPAS